MISVQEHSTCVLIERSENVEVNTRPDQRNACPNRRCGWFTYGKNWARQDRSRYRLAASWWYFWFRYRPSRGKANFAKDRSLYPSPVGVSNSLSNWSQTVVTYWPSVIVWQPCFSFWTSQHWATRPFSELRRTQFVSIMRGVYIQCTNAGQHLHGDEYSWLASIFYLG